MKNNKKPVIAYIHTHFDPEWYRSADSFNVRLVEIIDRAIEEINSFKLPSFYFDGQILGLLNYLQFRPEKEKLIKKLIKEKKFFIGPFFVSADNLVVPITAIVKNLEIGLKFSKKFGENGFIGYLSDVFGHSESIFKILKCFNIDYAIIWRGAPKDCPSEFIKNGIKTARLTYGYYQDILHTGKIDENKALEIEKILDKINEKSKDILLFPLGGDHLAPIQGAKEKIETINKYLKNYEITLASPFDYIKKVKYDKVLSEELLDNSDTYILQGVYSTRADEKIENTKLCHELFNKVIPLNYFLKGKFQNELEYASIELIKNQAHDSIYGCSTDCVSKKVKSRQKSVFDTANSVKSLLLRDFRQKFLKENSTDKIGIFNFSNYSQKGVIKFISDKKIKNAQRIKTFYSVSDEIMYNIDKNPMTEDFHNFYEYIAEIQDIKAFSFQNVKLTPPVKKTIAKDDFIENENLKLFIHEKKIYVINKKTGEIFEDFINLCSTPDLGDSYNFAPASKPCILKLLSSKKKYEGKIKSALEIKFEENIKLIISLTNEGELFDFNIEINNKKKNRKLQIMFNTKKPVFETVAKDPISEVKRSHDPNYLLFEHIPIKDRGELKTGAYPNSGYVLANEILIGTMGLYEYEIYKKSIKITLLRSTGIISTPKNPARGAPAGPPIDTPDMQMIGKYNFELFLKFESGSNEFQRQKFLEYIQNPFVCLLGDFKIKNKTFIKNDEKSYFLGITNDKPLFLSP